MEAPPKVADWYGRKLTLWRRVDEQEAEDEERRAGSHIKYNGKRIAREPDFDDNDGLSDGARDYQEMMADLEESDSEDEDSDNTDDTNMADSSPPAAGFSINPPRARRNAIVYWSDGEVDDSDVSPTPGSFVSPASKKRIMRFNRRHTSGHVPSTQVGQAGKAIAVQRKFASAYIGPPVPFNLSSPVLPPPAGTKRKLDDSEGMDILDGQISKAERQIKKLKARAVFVAKSEAMARLEGRAGRGRFVLGLRCALDRGGTASIGTPAMYPQQGGFQPMAQQYYNGYPLSTLRATTYQQAAYPTQHASQYQRVQSRSPVAAMAMLQSPRCQLGS